MAYFVLLADGHCISRSIERPRIADQRANRAARSESAWQLIAALRPAAHDDVVPHGPNCTGRRGVDRRDFERRIFSRDARPCAAVPARDAEWTCSPEVVGSSA